MNNNVTKWEVTCEYKGPQLFLDNAKDEVRRRVTETPDLKKVSMILMCVMVRDNPKTGGQIFTDVNARSKIHIIHDNFDDEYNAMRERVLRNLAKFQKEGSGWRLHSITKLIVSVVRYEPLAGSKYTTPLPKRLAGKKAIVNMQNRDNECFKWAITRTLNPKKDIPHRVTRELRQQAEKYDWDDVTFPTKVTDIGKWEKANNVGIDVFGYDEDDKRLYTVRTCDQSLKDNEIANLYPHDDIHYCAVADLSRLVSLQLSKNKRGKHICLRCISWFGTEKLLNEHQKLCKEHKVQRPQYPEE